MSEYLAATALIAVASIGTMGYFGETIQHQFAAMAQEVAGKDGNGETGKAASEGADKAGTAADGHKHLGNFATDNENG
jgi:Flp pilus assembly pilin Flp